MEYSHGNISVLDVYYNILQDMIFSIKNPFIYSREYLKKSRKVYKAKDLLDEIGNLSDKEKGEIVSEILTFMSKESNLSSIQESYNNLSEWNKKEGKFKDFFDKIEKTFKSLPSKEKIDLVKITFSNISVKISSLRDAVSNDVLESPNIEFLFVIGQALQVCQTLSETIIKEVGKKGTPDKEKEIGECVMFILTILMRLESIRRGESEIDKLYGDISIVNVNFLDKIKREGEYDLSKSITNEIYSVLEAD